MLKKIFFLLFLFFLLVFPPVFAAEDLDASSIVSYRLDNGLILLVQESREHQLAAVEIIVKTGSLYEQEWQGSGIAHLVEHMLFKGTLDRPEGKIEEEIKALGGSTNGYCSYEFTGYSLVLPSQNLSAGYEALADMISHPRFDEKEMIKEKEVILNEIRMNQDDPERYQQKLFLQKAYKIAPYNIPVIGQASLLSRITQADLREFFRRWYLPNNMIISVCGDVSAQEVFELTNKFFGQLPMNYYPQVSLPDVPMVRGKFTFEEAADVNTTFLSVGFSGVRLSDEDAPAMDILSAILGQGNSSRLSKNLIEKNRLAYAVQAYNYTPGYNGIFAVTLILDYQNKDAALREVFSEAKLIAEKGISPEELEKVKNNYLSAYIFNKQTVESMAGMAASDQAYAQDPDFSRAYIEALSRVNSADIQNCAKKYLRETDFVCVILKPKDSPPETEPRALPGRSLPEMIKLKSGARLILKPDDQSKTLSLLAVIGGGVRYEQNDNNGAFAFLSKLMTRGSRKYPGGKIFSQVEFLGASLSSFSGYNSYGLSLELLSKDYRKGVDIFLDSLVFPEFNNDQFEIVKTNMLNEIKTRDDDVFEYSLRRLRQNLFVRSPYRLDTIGTKESLDNLNPEYLRQTHYRHLFASNLVLTVSGKFDKTEIIRLIDKNLDKVPGVFALRPEDFGEPELTRQIQIEDSLDRKQSIIVLGFQGPNLKSPDYLTAQVLISVLTSPGAILYDQIREKLGAAYTLGGQAVYGPDHGYLFIYVATDAENVVPVKKVIFENIIKLNTELLSPETIQVTKNYLIGKHEINLQADLDLSYVNALDELYGLGYDNYAAYSEKISAITPDKLLETANRYFDLEKAVIVIVKGQTHD